MKDLTISAKDGKDGKSATITLGVPGDASEAIKEYGDGPVYTNAMAHWVVTLQAGIRRMIKAGSTQEQIQAKFADAKMGVAATRTTDPYAAIKAGWKDKSPEERAAFIKELRELDKAAG